MILVCALYAISWLPEKTFILLLGLDDNLTYMNNVYYASLFLGFLYICANLLIIVWTLSVESAWPQWTMFINDIRNDQLHPAKLGHNFSISAPTLSFTPQSLIRSDAP